jgi:hypothetical protein
MSSVPSDPSSGDYQYNANGNQDAFCLAAQLEGSSTPSDDVDDGPSVCNFGNSLSSGGSGGVYTITN